MVLYRMSTRLFLLLLCASMAAALLELKKEEIGTQYRIGTITDLFFIIKDKLFFKADRGVFGFISPADGSLLEVYELEPNEKMLSYVTAGEIIIVKDERILNSFFSLRSSYTKLAETEALKRQSNYSTLLDFRRHFTNTFILTDRFLLKVPFMNKPVVGATGQKKEEEAVLFELGGSDEAMFSLAHVLDLDVRKPLIFMVTLKDAGRLLCFREVGEGMSEKEPTCLEVLEGLTVESIASSFEHIYIEYTDCVMVYSKRLKFVERIDERPLQYFRGFASLGSHGSFDPATGKRLERRVIWEHQMTLLRTVEVEETELFIQTINEQTGDITQIVTIPKSAQENPRKFWAHTAQKDSVTFRLYIEYEGRLTCYEVDSGNKSYAILWEITTAEPDDADPNEAASVEANAEDSANDLEEMQGLNP